MSNITDLEIINLENYRIEHYRRPTDCYEMLQEQIDRYMKLPERLIERKKSLVNYDFSDDGQHTLRHLIENNKFHLGYTILYDNDIPTAFGGIRVYNRTTTIIAARSFCFPTTKLLINKILIPYHLDISKKHGYKKSIITMNDYNHKIYKMWPYLDKRPSLIDDSRWSVDSSKYFMLGSMHIKNSDQYIIQWNLD
jgi:hypothetical protein